MTALFRELITDAVAARLPHTVAVQQRIEATVDQAIDEGLDEQAIEDRVITLLWDDPDARAVAHRRGTMAAFVEHALTVGATYDAPTDIWTPPAGMTFEGLFTAIIARLRSEDGGEDSI